jgi:hypothetical protein
MLANAARKLGCIKQDKGKVMLKNKIAPSLRRLFLAGIALPTFCALAPTARAGNYMFDNGVEINFDNTLQYSVLERTAPESSYFQNQINANDGDNNLRAGIVSNRFDLLTKFDIKYNDFGFDVSAFSFYDTVYNQNTQNHDTLTYNPESVPSSKFTTATQVQDGRNIELRNLFVYGSQNLDGVPVTLRVGRLVNIFGESLFFGNNGIAYGNGPIDINRAVSVPNTQAKDLFLPVGQALLSVQPTDSISISAYYMFEWEKYLFIPSGSYFSPTDILDAGGERIIAFAPTAFSPGGYFYRGADQSGASTGQFGIALHYDPTDSDYDIGLYALQYNDSEPQVYVRPNAGPPTFIPGTPAALSLGQYQLVYPDHIQIYGASGSTTFGPVNIAGEVSVRMNEPLESSVTLAPGEFANNSNAPRYATGNTLHYQASAIYLGSATPLWQGCSWLTEIAADSLLAFDKNRQNFNPAYRHMALGFRTLFTADYFHVLPALDLAVPVGLGWDFMGLAPDTAGFNNYGIDRGGDLTIGLNATYNTVWTAGISYTRFIAPPARNAYADRDFAEFNIERTF